MASLGCRRILFEVAQGYDFRELKMILAGDIGATKTVLALFSITDGVDGGEIHKTRYNSRDYASLEAIIEAFLAATGAKPSAACFGVAGPGAAAAGSPGCMAAQVGLVPLSRRRDPLPSAA